MLQLKAEPDSRMDLSVYHHRLHAQNRGKVANIEELSWITERAEDEALKNFEAIVSDANDNCTYPYLTLSVIRNNVHILDVNISVLDRGTVDTFIGGVVIVDKLLSKKRDHSCRGRNNLNAFLTSIGLYLKYGHYTPEVC